MEFVYVEVNLGEFGEFKFVFVGLFDMVVKELNDCVFFVFGNSGF